MTGGDEVSEFHARARRRRRGVDAIAIIIMLGVGGVAIYLSAITEKSTTFTRYTDLEPAQRTVVVAAVVILVSLMFWYRVRKDRRR